METKHSEKTYFKNEMWKINSHNSKIFSIVIIIFESLSIPLFIIFDFRTFPNPGSFYVICNVCLLIISIFICIFTDKHKDIEEAVIKRKLTTTKMASAKKLNNEKNDNIMANKIVDYSLGLINIYGILIIIWCTILTCLEMFNTSSMGIFMLTIATTIVLPTVIYLPNVLYIISVMLSTGTIISFYYIFPEECSYIAEENIIVSAIFAIIAIIINIVNNRHREISTNQKLENDLQRDLEIETNAKMATLIEELHQASVTDGLTGLYNRAYLEEVSKDVWKNHSHSKTGIAIAMIDVDDFKQINDTYGHTAGDEALKIVSKLILEMAISHNGLAFRYGGEEFLVLFRGKDYEYVLTCMHSLEHSMAQVVIPANERCHISISTGIANAEPAKDFDFWSLVDEADKKLYEGKRAKGKNHSFGR